MATTSQIRVPEIHCDHCKSSIEGALQPLVGVADAQVDVQAKTVAVTFDESVVSRDALLDAIEEQGYAVPR